MASYAYDPNAQPQYAAPAPAPATAYAPAPAGYAPAPAAAYAPAPAYGYAPAPSYNPDEVRTVFVTGFPADVKERELNNLLRFVHGYEASQMHWKNGMAQGFALFSHGAAAGQAIQTINGLMFDDGVVLRCEMARKNMYIRDDAAGAKRGRVGGEYNPYGAATASPMPAYYTPAPAPAQPRSYAPVTNTKDNPPCNTLFIGNLSEHTSEDELRGIFQSQPGFRQLKLVRGARSITCFVEFSDVTTAMAVHNSQQGAVLSTSDRGGIRIQYSKNPFGKKRDASGNWISTNENGSFAAPTHDPNDAGVAGVSYNTASYDPAAAPLQQQQPAAAYDPSMPAAAPPVDPAGGGYDTQAVGVIDGGAGVQTEQPAAY